MRFSGSPSPPIGWSAMLWKKNKQKTGAIVCYEGKKTKQEKREELKVSVLKQPTPKDIVTKWVNWRASDWWWYNGDNALSLLTVYACYVPLSLSLQKSRFLCTFCLSFFVRRPFIFSVYSVWLCRRLTVDSRVLPHYERRLRPTAQCPFILHT